MSQAWPLVGREPELARITAMLDDADCRGVLLAGPAGVGKSRLADALVRVEPTRVVARARATRAAATLPFGALAALLPSDGPPDESGARRLRRAVAALLDLAPPGDRLVLAVDDVHALDDASATLLLQVALTGRAFLLLTLRTGEPVSDAVTALWRDELVERLDLQPLGATALAGVLRAALGGDVDGGTVHALYSASGGNMLYLRELVHGLVDSGTLAAQDGVWHLSAPITAPPRLAELVGLALDALPADERTVLETVALGEPLGVTDLTAHASGAALDQLEARGLVEVGLDGRRHQVRLAHPMFGEVARDRLPSGRRLAILEDLVAMHAAHGRRRRDDERRLAVWQLEAGQPADGAALLDAACDAFTTNDSHAAVRFASAAVAAGADPRAYDVLGKGLDDLGRHVEADEAYATFAALATDELSVTRAAVGRAGNMFRGLGLAEEASTLLSATAERIADPLLQDEILSERSIFRSFEGRVDETIALSDPLLSRGDDRGFCLGALSGGIVRVIAGREREAIDLATQAFERRVALGDQLDIAEPGLFLVVLALAQLEAGHLAEALATAEATYDGAVGAQDRHGQAWLAIAIARIQLHTGCLADAERFGREGWVVFTQLDHAGARWGMGAVALAAGQRGDAATAAHAIGALDQQPPTPITIMDIDLDRGRAWAAAAAGRRSDALALLHDAAARSVDLGHFALGLGAAHDLARLGDVEGAMRRVDDFTDRVDGLLGPARVAHVRALAEDDARALDVVGEAFAAMGARLFAAEAFAAAAARHGREGLQRAAAAARRRADELAASCQDARTPALERADALTPTALTRREREVADLVANGLTNKEVADALVLSVRTIENHLQRVYEKLGVHGRDELAQALDAVGTVAPTPARHDR